MCCKTPTETIIYSLGVAFAMMCAAAYAQDANSDTVTLQFINNLKEPNFNFDISLETKRAFTILELMEQAAWQNITFKYAVGYFGTVPGYMVYAVRKDLVQGGTVVPQPFVFADVNWDDDHSYWSIKIDGKSIPVGISGYQPKAGDTVVFELVTSPCTDQSSCGSEENCY